jgi:DNA-binding beta-propeller fold protein YncE
MNKTILLALLLPATTAGQTTLSIPVEKLYADHCATCHQATRLGGTGPALLPENLGRLTKKDAAAVIANGRTATQMQGFAKTLTTAQIQTLVDYIYTPLPTVPVMGMPEIQATQVVPNSLASLSPKPVYPADPLNLFLIVEAGDHHITVLDGDKLEPLSRFPTRFALHGGIKYSPEGRFAYLASRDGWVSKYDVYNLKMVAEIRAGINTRNIAVSADGNYVIVANYLPHTLVVLNATDLMPLQILEAKDDTGKSSRVSAVYTAPPRHSFIAALKDLPEIWEIPYSPKAEALPVYQGPMHDYRVDSGETPPLDKRPFPVRRIKVADYLDEFFFDKNYLHLIGSAREGGKGQVINLVIGGKIAELDLAGMPHLASGITWDYQGKPVLATPNLKAGLVTVVDLQNWQVIKRIETIGAGSFMRSHDATPYAWVDAFFSPQKDAVQVIDKNTLTIVKTLRPAPGKTVTHIEFDRYGRYALLSLYENDGAIIVYDAKTLTEVKRLPMRKPVGKYNIYNKIHYSSGTSH